MGLFHKMPKCQILGALLLSLSAPTIVTAGSYVTVQEVRVVSATGEGVKSELIEKTRDDRELNLDETNESGVFDRKYNCPEWHKIYAKPVSGPFTNSKAKPCAKRLKLIVGSPPITRGLYKKGQIFLEKGDKATAALLFNDVYIRAAQEKLDLAELARRQAIVITGEKLGVSKPMVLDPALNRWVASNELVSALKNYQTKFGLNIKSKQRGTINYRTLSHMSGKSIGPFIVEAGRK